jgi:site-specific recombinase XerD
MNDTEALLTSWSLGLHDKAKSTRTLYLDSIRRFARELPEGVTLDTVSRQDVQRYLARLQADGLARATIRSRWIALRSFYGWALLEDEIDANPMEGLKVARADPPPPKFPEDADIKLLFKSLTGRGIWERRDLAMIRLTAATGMRLGELCALRLEDVDLSKQIIFVRHGKGDKARLCRFDRETGAVVDRYLRTRARYRLGMLPELWISRFGPFGGKGAQHMIGRRCEQAGITPFGWHSLRHRFAHSFLERGGQEGSLARLGGWSDPAVMRRYGASRATDRALEEYETLGGVL